MSIPKEEKIRNSLIEEYKSSYNVSFYNKC